MKRANVQSIWGCRYLIIMLTFPINNFNHFRLKIQAYMWMFPIHQQKLIKNVGIQIVLLFTWDCFFYIYKSSKDHICNFWVPINFQNWIKLRILTKMLYCKCLTDCLKFMVFWVIRSLISTYIQQNQNKQRLASFSSHFLNTKANL